MSRRIDRQKGPVPSHWPVEADLLEKCEAELSAEFSERERAMEEELSEAKTRLNDMVDRTIASVEEEFLDMKSKLLIEENEIRTENKEILERFEEDLSMCSLEDIVDRAFSLITFPEKEESAFDP